MGKGGQRSRVVTHRPDLTTSLNPKLRGDANMIYRHLRHTCASLCGCAMPMSEMMCLCLRSKCGASGVESMRKREGDHLRELGS